MTFSWNADGSTQWIFVQMSGLNGFAVVDFATHKEVKRIQNPDLPPGNRPVPRAPIPLTGWPSRRMAKHWWSAAG
jgi:hypothetical protein